MRLIFLRHAKAADTSAAGDHGRSITEKGRARAAAVGQQLAAYGIDHALVSTAKRTRETFACLGLDVPVTYLDELYAGGSFEYIHQAFTEAGLDDPQAVLVVGHVPAIQAWAFALAQASGNSAAAEEIGRWFPTAAYAAFDIENTSWQDFINWGTAHHVRLLELSRR